MPLGGKAQLKSTLTHANITAITEWQLPDPGRLPNSVTTAPDGSVWFGEQSVPGVAHFFPNNGTLVEYAWPETAVQLQGTCPFKASIWGIALWKGMVWATDQDGNSIVGLNPVNGSFEVLNLPQPNSSPYTLTVGPDGALWFTALTNTAFIGRVSPSLVVSMYPVMNQSAEIPTDIQFVNSSFAYYTALDPYKPTPSGVYSFDPQDVAGGVSPEAVGGNVTLTELTSLAISSNVVWVVQHYTSNIWGYDLATHEWTVYPTSTENYTSTTLPYFVRTSGETVWFNEHYGNRIAELDPAPIGTLTEFSEADPPVSNGTQIQNDLTIAAAPSGLWFTSTTGNYIGFANASYKPSFWISAQGLDSVNLSQGADTVAQFQVGGTWGKSLQVAVSDSEGYSSVPDLITIRPSVTDIPRGSGPVSLTVALSLNGDLAPGPYTVAVTVSDGLVSQTAYLFVTVT
ncbi:MAG: hypothetical protein ACLQEQ_01470 [Nitrososphaerales archaeon]